MSARDVGGCDARRGRRRRVWQAALLATSVCTCLAAQRLGNGGGGDGSSSVGSGSGGSDGSGSGGGGSGDGDGDGPAARAGLRPSFGVSAASKEATAAVAGRQPRKGEARARGRVGFKGWLGPEARGLRGIGGSDLGDERNSLSRGSAAATRGDDDGGGSELQARTDIGLGRADRKEGSGAEARLSADGIPAAEAIGALRGALHGALRLDDVPRPSASAAKRKVFRSSSAFGRPGSITGRRPNSATGGRLEGGGKGRPRPGGGRGVQTAVTRLSKDSSFAQGQRRRRRLQQRGETASQGDDFNDDGGGDNGFGSVGLLAFLISFGILFCVMEVAKCYFLWECRRRQLWRRERAQSNAREARLPIASSRMAESEVPPVTRSKDDWVDVVVDGVTMSEEPSGDNNVPSTTGYAVAGASHALQEAIEHARRLSPRRGYRAVFTSLRSEMPLEMSSDMVPSSGMGMDLEMETRRLSEMSPVPSEISPRSSTFVSTPATAAAAAAAAASRSAS